MPGLAGIIGIGQKEENASRLRQMVSCMMHEPFYVSGECLSEELRSWLGWVCVKGSFANCLPIWNEKKDIGLLFSGEDYTDSEQIAELRRKGHEFEAGNASYLVHLYEERDCDFIQHLNGRFCGVVLDYRRGKTILFNDRFGLNRIYYLERDGAVYFSSEAKSLLSVFPELRRIDPEALAQVVSFGAVLQNKTLYPHVSLVPGGTVWTFQSGRKSGTDSYFHPRQWECQEPLSGREYYNKVKETWIRVLPRYLRDSERLALSLTGGKDSRMILAWSQASPGELPCYTFGGTYRDCHDVRIARRVAEVSRQPFHVIRLDESFFLRFPEYAARTVYLTDGTMDVSGSPGLYVNKIAREIAPIRLTGNYGQEILEASVAFKPSRFFPEILEDDFGRLVEKASQLYHDELRGNRMSFIAFKQVPWVHYARLTSELSQLTMRSPYLDNEIVKLAFQSSAEPVRLDELQLRLIAEGNGELGKIETDRGLLFKPVPFYSFLKRCLRELSFKAEYVYDYGMPQAVAKIDRFFHKLHLERLFLGRHKYYHFRIWYRDELSKHIKDILLDPRTTGRPFLQGNKIEKMVNSHIKGTANFTAAIQKILSLEFVYRQFIDSR